MSKRLLLLSFVEGACVMCAELCGARLLAPLFGSSLFVWATVMGITLGALALGYFAGGHASRSRDNARLLRSLLVFASLYLLLMPLLAHLVLPRISLLSFIPGMITGSALLLLPPVFLLGATSPLFISLQAKGETAAGQASGLVYAVSTMGGIVSTFACGFLLIPALGLSTTLYSHGILLLLLTFILLNKAGSWLYFLAAGGIICFTFCIPGENLVMAEDGIDGRIAVQDLTEQGVRKRRLLLNNIIQSEVDVGSGKSTLAYIRVLDSLIPSARAGRGLVLGAGASSAANLLAEKGYRCVAVEFDPRVIEAAREHFVVHDSVLLVQDDARRFINQSREKFDVILVDVFRAEEQPSHILTRESLLKVKTMLAAGAYLIVNWHGYTEGVLAEGTNALRSTLADAGFAVNPFYTGSNPHYRNTLFMARPARISARPETVINTDDRPVLERFNALANMTWRRNYLRYYQSAPIQ